jgi:hypothetical protein
METIPPQKAKPNRNLIIAGIAAVLICLCVSSSSAICLLGIYLFSGDLTGPSAPSAPNPTSLVRTNDFTDTLETPVLAAAARGTVHLFWHESANSGLFHMQKNLQGKWTSKESLGEYSQPVARLTPDGTICFFAFGVPSDSSYRYDWYERCQVESGWSEPKPLADTDLHMTEAAPAFAPDGSLQIAYWATDGLYLNHDLILKTGERLRNLHFTIDTAGGFHAAWQDEVNSTIQYLFSGDGGVKWQPVESLAEFSGPGGFSNFELLADRQGGVHLFWMGQSQIYHRRRAPDGNWGAVETVADTGLYPMTGMSCAVDGQGVGYVFWRHYFPDTNQDGASLSRQNTDGTWDPPVWVVSPRKSLDVVAMELAMAVDTEGRMHFVWQRMYMTNNGPTGYSLDYISLS